MTKRQRENTARYLYDISKIVFAASVVGNLIAWKQFNMLIFLVGAGMGLIIFWFGYRLDGGVPGDG